jgi:quercetin dioxygenase-like cupin family protein
LDSLPAVPSSCSLDQIGLRALRERYRAAGAGATIVEWSARRIVIRVADEVVDKLVQEAVAVERACCPFFELAWEPGQRRLTVAVLRAEEEPALDAIAHALGLRHRGEQPGMAVRAEPMTTRVSEIFNRVTSERIVFRRTTEETDGVLLEFDDFWSRPDHRVLPHVHPGMEERWEIIAGAVRFRIDGEERTARAGDIVIAPAGSTHGSWNVGEEPVHLRVEMTPALRWEEFTRRLFDAAEQGRTDDRGTPEPRLLADLLTEFHRELAPPR